MGRDQVKVEFYNKCRKILNNNPSLKELINVEDQTNQFLGIVNLTAADRCQLYSILVLCTAKQAEALSEKIEIIEVPTLSHH